MQNMPKAYNHNVSGHNVRMMKYAPVFEEDTVSLSTIEEEPSLEVLYGRSDINSRESTVSPKGDVFYFEPDSPTLSSPSPSLINSSASDNGSISNTHYIQNSSTNNPHYASISSVNSHSNVNINPATHRSTGRKIKPNGHNNTAHSASANAQGARFYDLPSGSPRKVRMFVDPNRHNLGRRASLCERVLGIIPGRFSLVHGADSALSGESYHDDQRIMVQGLLPGGEALRCGVKTGEWLVSVDENNVDFMCIDKVLAAISSPVQVIVTLQKVITQTRHSLFLERNGHVSSENHGLVRLVSGERLKEEPMSLEGVPHGLLYLTLDCQSDTLQDKEDILYQFPQDCDSRLVDIRGAFITLCHMMLDVSNNTAKSSALVVNGQLLHAAYYKENREVLVFLIPALKLCLLQVSKLLEKLVQTLKVLYGSLHSAFCCHENHAQLDQLLTLVMQRHLLAEELYSHGAKQSELLEPMFDVLPACRALILPENTKVLISNCLSELESADFVDMSEDYYELRRRYVIQGSCLFYKGYLLASHLRNEDLRDLSTYLQLHCLLSVCHEEQLGQLLVWREVFPTRRCHQQVDPLLPGYTEPEARWFILVVGLKNALLGVMLEAGGCAAWAEGNPGPDSFYVDQTKATLLQLEALDAFGQCELRLQGPPVPSLAGTDWFLPHGKGAKQDEPSTVASFVTSLVKGQGSPKVSRSTPAKKTVNQSDSLLKTRSIPSPRSRSLDMESDGEGDSLANSDGSSSRRRGRRLSFGSDDSFDGNSSGVFKTGRRRRNLLNVVDVSDQRRGISDVNATDGSFVKITSGCDNTLFHYISFDAVDGVFVCPTQQELLQNISSLHNKLLYNFHQACISIHSQFVHCRKIKKLKESGCTRINPYGLNEGCGNVYEQGILFQCIPDNISENKKPTPVVQYWVIGRCMEEPHYKEFYACFHDSSPQNIVEMAFKLGFGTNI